MEFGLVPDASGLDRDDFITLGVRMSLKDPTLNLNIPNIAKLSADQRFPSKIPLIRHFTSIPTYRETVQEVLREYGAFCDNLTNTGVTSAVISALEGSFVAGNEFMNDLAMHADTLLKLSRPEADYVLHIIKNGFDLINEDIFALQLADFTGRLNKIGVSQAEHDFVFRLVPRITPADVLIYLER